MPYLPLTDASVASKLPPLIPHVDAGASSTTRLTKTANLRRVRLKSTNDSLCIAYQDWMHQNPGTRLDDGINDYGKCQARWKTLLYFLTQCYDVPSGRVGELFVSALAADIDGIRAWKYNTKCVIVFKTVILQRV